MKKVIIALVVPLLMILGHLGCDNSNSVAQNTGIGAEMPGPETVAETTFSGKVPSPRI
jgi:hypothetical protein